MLVFNAVLAIFTYAILRLQALLPLNPLHFPALPGHLAANTAVSFTTNTNWQSYSGESTMSNLSQMLGLTIHNFMSAATGIALAFAFFRGFARRETKTASAISGQMRRASPSICCCRSAWSMRWCWSPMACRRRWPDRSGSNTLEGVKQTLALGPVASQEAIKMLGTNGGGFFNANSRASLSRTPTLLPTSSRCSRSS